MESLTEATVLGSSEAIPCRQPHHHNGLDPSLVVCGLVEQSTLLGKSVPMVVWAFSAASQTTVG